MLILDRILQMPVLVKSLLEVFPVKVVDARPLGGAPNDWGVDQLGPQGGDPHYPGSGALLGCFLDNLQQVQSEIHQPKVIHTKGNLQQHHPCSHMDKLNMLVRVGS